ncbi:Protein DA1-like [Trema orientale]|uniref:Protein DA1-like n=1 Tax=Trema orientale TaxID=63057 RepID=A0A2P5FZJ5_TREOI|nr:Protein DA1-like [Trema orientale]
MYSDDFCAVKGLIDHEQITLRVMGWLSKIFKGSSHKISEGHYRDKYGEESTSYAPSHSGETWSENDNEEIDRAIALSLLEESQKGKRLIDNDSQLQEDEQLARALQESLNVESPPGYGNGYGNAYGNGSGNGNGNGSGYGYGYGYGNANSYQPIPVYYPTGYRICAGCQTEIGYGRLLTGSILAHEMMHAWLRLKGYRTLSQDVEEGICQVVAHMWLDAELTSGSGSNIASTSSSSSSSSSSSASKKGARSHFEKKLGEFFKHQIESDISPVYGDGYRAGQRAVQKYGLRRTLDHIRMTGTFPY